MTRARGTTNGNARGSSLERRRRKQWLLDTFGNGRRARCATCPAWLTFETITVDRWPLAGCEGGTYRRGNIRPQCAPCASLQGGLLGSARRGADLWRYALPSAMR